MSPVSLLLLCALLPSCLCHQDPFAWLYGPRGQAMAALQADRAGGDCPAECDCPPTFPVAMYCDDRGLTVMPFIPERIKYLYLQHNHISAVPDSAMVNASNLVWLMLHHNQIRSEEIGKKITTADFEGMDNLTVLYLQQNSISEISSSLKDLASLTLLDISGNKLTKIPESLPAHLHQLYLESNSIDSVPEGFLGRFTQLQYVRMAHNQLTDKGIPPNTFNVSGLVELDLSFNRLERIPIVSTTLQHLYLQANSIKEFTLGSFCSVVDISNFSKLRTLRLDGNEIGRQDIPIESSQCLRQASEINI
ncbi:hypothetical protein WMY93_011817 [Mugilogobius chulae]|uniref:Fibromodulin n=1 Tax=Mugilogobius chulae TaxID=88201 RepID=A0AAW0P9G1_9GOBI